MTDDNTEREYPRPRFGGDLSATELADNLEQYAEKLRAGEGYLQGVDIRHRADHDQYPSVELRIRTAAHPDIPLLDLPVYDEPRYR